MRRFWFKFDTAIELPPGVAYGCGITAYDYDDAQQLARQRVFAGTEMPDPARTVEDVDISQLDRDHVLPNMGDPVVRGVWFPRGFD